MLAPPPPTAASTKRHQHQLARGHAEPERRCEQPRQQVCNRSDERQRTGSSSVTARASWSERGRPKIAGGFLGFQRVTLPCSTMEYELFNCVPVVRKVQRRKSDVFELQDEQLPVPERKALLPFNRQSRRDSRTQASGASSTDSKTWSISVQGGTPSSTDEREYHDAVERILRTGGGILAAGGTSRDAMEATINLMEESLSHRISETRR